MARQTIKTTKKYRRKKSNSKRCKTCGRYR